MTVGAFHGGGYILLFLHGKSLGSDDGRARELCDAGARCQIPACVMMRQVSPVDEKTKIKKIYIES